MKKVKVTTGWIGTGTRDDPYRPKVADDHNMTFPSGIPPADPKLGGTMTVTGVVSDTDYLALAADLAYAPSLTLLASV